MTRGLLLITSSIAAATAIGQTYPVAGVIVNTQTGSPMKHIHMVLNGPQGRPPMALDTAEDGRFSFEVPKGKYSLTAQIGGVQQTYGLEGPGIGFGVFLYTGPGQDVSNLTFHWFPGGVITGTVIDDRREPVENALVQLIRSSVTGGRRRLSTAAWSRADDRGVYRFAPVVGGTYYLAVTAEPWYLGHLPSVRRPLPNQPAPPAEPVPAYAPLYYPSASDLQSAGAIVLKPGAEYHADFALRTVNGVNVHVNCPTANGRTGLVTLIADPIEGVEAPDGYQRQLRFNGYPLTISGVPQGRYVVVISSTGSNGFSARKTIDVGAGDVTVDLPILSGTTVTGKLTFTDPKAQRKSSLYLRLTNIATNASISRAVGPDGSFSFPNVGAGTLRPEILGSDGFYIAQGSVDGTLLRNGTFEIADGATVSLAVAASGEIGHLKGFVMAGDRPVPGVLVVLTPKNESSNSSATYVFQTDSDGSFDWANIRAGDYVLFAIAKLDLEYLDAAEVRPYLAIGKTMRIEAHQEYSENIGLSPIAMKE